MVTLSRNYFRAGHYQKVLLNILTVNEFRAEFNNASIKYFILHELSGYLSSGWARII